ncbi:MAG: hypothetical protein AAFY20_23960 [Cyanobacteria bacterium J06639_14]
MKDLQPLDDHYRVLSHLTSHESISIPQCQEFLELKYNQYARNILLALERTGCVTSSQARYPRRFSLLPFGYRLNLVPEHGYCLSTVDLRLLDALEEPPLTTRKLASLMGYTEVWIHKRVNKLSDLGLVLYDSPLFRLSPNAKGLMEAISASADFGARVSELVKSNPGEIFFAADLALELGVSTSFAEASMSKLSGLSGVVFDAANFTEAAVYADVDLHEVAA